MPSKSAFTVTVEGENLGVFDEAELTIDDAFTLESNAGMTFPIMLAGFKKYEAAPMRALVWWMHYKRGDAILPADVKTFKITELKWEQVVGKNPTQARAAKSGTDTSGS